MPVKIGGYDFQGWYNFKSTLDNEPGLYAIGCEKDNKIKVIDVGESDDIRDRVEKHDRKDCWEKECKRGSLKYAQYKTRVDKKKRLEIEKEIRNKEKPSCGEE